MISRQNFGPLGILMVSLATLFAAPNQSQAQQSHGFRPAYGSSPIVGATASGRLQPAYMPAAHQPAAPIAQAIPVHATPSHAVWAQPQTLNQTVQPTYYPQAQVVTPTTQPYVAAEQMVNSRVPKRQDIMAIEQHTLLQYRRLYRNGSTPSPRELTGQWNGVNKGIVEVAGYRQFVKDIQVGVNGQATGDNVQVSQVKPGQLRLDGWQPKFDLQTSDYERRGSFAVQAPSGRGFFGHGVTFSYADGNNPHNDPARLLEDQVVKVDGNHMIGRAVAKFGPIKIPLAYFVLERRQ